MVARPMGTDVRRYTASLARWVALAIGAAPWMWPASARAQQASGAPPASLESTVWTFDSTRAGPMRAVVSIPRDRRADERFPLLVVFHGSSESAAGVAEGAWGWLHAYGLGATEAALRDATLPRRVFGWRVTEERRALLQRELRRAPYRGLVIVMPYTPDFLSGGRMDSFRAYDAWVANVLVPRARRELPVLSTRESTGVDGVSMGGFVSLLVGFAHPDVFGVVGALLPAVRGASGTVMNAYGRSADRPHQAIRIVTSDRDYLRADITHLSSVLHTRGIGHEFRQLGGGHDYEFSRGPGGIEMLLWHDRAQRGEPCP